MCQVIVMIQIPKYKIVSIYTLLHFGMHKKLFILVFLSSKLTNFKKTIQNILKTLNESMTANNTKIWQHVYVNTLQITVSLSQYNILGLILWRSGPFEYYLKKIFILFYFQYQILHSIVWEFHLKFPLLISVLISVCDNTKKELWLLLPKIKIILIRRSRPTI